MLKLRFREEPADRKVFANVDPSAGYKGITCFVMSKDMGVEITKKEAKVDYLIHAPSHTDE
jgi:alkylation response protein AidB-like acyl-CoA dehydrogenase